MFFRALGIVGCVSLVGFASAQKLVFDFQKIADNFTAVGVSKNQEVLGTYNRGYARWSPAGGLVELEDAKDMEYEFNGDRVYGRFDADGNVIGISRRNGNTQISRWDKFGKKTKVIDVPKESVYYYNITDFESNGDFVLTGDADRRFIYTASKGTLEIPTKDHLGNPYPVGFKFTGIGKNGVHYGKLPGYTRTTYDPFSEVTFGGSVVSLGPFRIMGESGYSIRTAYQHYSEEVRFNEFEDGSRIVSYNFQNRTSTGGTDWRFRGVMFNAFGSPIGTFDRFNARADESWLNLASARKSGFVFGDVQTVSVNKEVKRGIGYSTYFGDYQILDETNFWPGSVMPTAFLPDDNFDEDPDYVLASKDGASYISRIQFGTVPEPVTLAAIGLGAAAMLRRKRLKSKRV